MSDLMLVQAYLENVQAALTNGQSEHAQFLTTRAQEILGAQSSHPSYAPFLLQIGMELNRGRKRWATPNEDCVFATTSVTAGGELFGVFLVADGAGGHVLGQQAARLALQECVEYLFPCLQKEGPHGVALRSLLVEGVQKANRALYLQNERTAVGTDRMCTTMTAMVTVGSEAWVANVGDSRTYHYRSSTGLAQITRDHSLVAQLLESQQITREQMRTHPERNKILRGLGDRLEEEIDVFSGTIIAGDVYLLCSDGLWEMVADEEIREILAGAPYTQPSIVAGQLVSRALVNGGCDNIGIVLVQVNGIDTIGGEQTIILSPARAPSPLPV